MSGRRAAWKLLADAIGKEVCARVKALDDRSLHLLLRSLRESPPTQTNCWWVSHAIAPIIKNAARYELHSRRVRARELAKLARAAATARGNSAPDHVRVTRKRDVPLLKR